MILSLRVPHLGTRAFVKWIKTPENLQQVQKSMGELETGTYVSSDKLFRFKDKFVSFMRGTNNLLLYLLALGANAGTVWFYLIRKDSTLGDATIWADIITGVSIILNFLVLIFASSFYLRPVPNHKWKQVIIRILTHLVLIFIVLVYWGFIIIFFFAGQIFPTDQAFVTFLWEVHNLAFYVLHGLVFFLLVVLLPSKDILIMLEPLGGRGVPAQSIRGGNFAKLLKILHYFWGFILSVLLLAALVLSLSLLAGEYLLGMFWGFFNLSLLIGLFIPICLWLLKVAHKSPHRGPNQRYWTIVKITTIIAGINLLPLITTPLFTHPTLDAQFEALFGPNWQTPRSGDYAPMREYRYSFLDTLFGWDIPVNARYNQSYMTDYPTFTSGNTSIITHEFFFDAYLPAGIAFGPTGGSVALPVIIMMHGEVEDKGAWNANWTSQYLANLGYLVCDMNYGYITDNAHGLNYNGYLIRDVVEQIGQFTRVLYENRTYFHADLGNVYFSGRHLGGAYALMCGHGYNSTLAGLFSEYLVVRGVIPFYPICDLGTNDTLFNGIYTNKAKHPIINGSSNPSDPDYTPDWINLNPIKIADNVNRPPGSRLAPTLLFEGTHDYLIPVSGIENYASVMKSNNHDIIVGYYFLGVDGFDGAHFSPWGQSMLFYLERFLALTH